ncbi:uncharacterized protein [Argopecten irradians]|uniref:uncharacterized protein n=1 Tax=Argopecten irradians TaxID=31199 RepID=UPI003715675F
MTTGSIKALPYKVLAYLTPTSECENTGETILCYTVMTRRNRPVINVIDLSMERKMEVIPTNTVCAKNNRGHTGSPIKAKGDINRQSGRNDGGRGSPKSSSLDVRAKSLRPKSSASGKDLCNYVSYYKNIIPFQTTQKQTSSFLPSFCYPLTITSLRSTKDVKRSKSETNVRTEVKSSECLNFDDIRKDIDHTPERTGFKKDLFHFETNVYKRRRSHEHMNPGIKTWSSASELDHQTRKISETEYAIYDSKDSEPRIVRIRNDINFSCPILTNGSEYDFSTDGGFQDIDLSLDPNTIDISLDDDCFNT